MSQKSKRSFSIFESVEKALGFDDGDLKANREGVLSERQRQQMANKQSNLVIVIAILTLIFVITTVQGFVSVIGRTTADLGFTVLVWTFSGISLATSTYRYLGMRADAGNEKVSSISGVVRRRKALDENRQKGEQLYYIYMDDLKFRFKVDEHVYDAFANRGLKGGYYTLYYLPRSKTILSAEPLDNPVTGNTVQPGDEKSVDLNVG
jgi:hypothetical protein